MAKIRMETLEKLEKSGMEGALIVQAVCKSVFDQVANPKDWKAPIEVTLPALRFEHYTEAVVRYAIIYFTGNPDLSIGYPEVGYMSFKSQGYRNGPCGG